MCVSGQPFLNTVFAYRGFFFGPRNPKREKDGDGLIAVGHAKNHLFFVSALCSGFISSSFPVLIVSRNAVSHILRSLGEVGLIGIDDWRLTSISFFLPPRASFHTTGKPLGIIPRTRIFIYSRHSTFSNLCCFKWRHKSNFMPFASFFFLSVERILIFHSHHSSFQRKETTRSHHEGGKSHQKRSRKDSKRGNWHDLFHP